MPASDASPILPRESERSRTRLGMASEAVHREATAPARDERTGATVSRALKSCGPSGPRFDEPIVPDEVDGIRPQRRGAQSS